MSFFGLGKKMSHVKKRNIAILNQAIADEYNKQYLRVYKVMLVKINSDTPLTRTEAEWMDKLIKEYGSTFLMHEPTATKRAAYIARGLRYVHKRTKRAVGKVGSVNPVSIFNIKSKSPLGGN